MGEERGALNNMRILLSNDDGVQAEGIQVLAAHLQAIGEVIVAAPDRQRSAAGHGITLHKPLFVERVHTDANYQAYGISGTPADCVKLGCNQLFQDIKPDIVVSGINQGGNLGTDLLYSGTVSAAIEGAVQGLPAIAVSLCGYRDLQYEEAAQFTVKLVQQVMKNGLLADTILNVNVPKTPAVGEREVRITQLGTRRYQNQYDVRSNPRGTPYYWLAGELKDVPNEPDSDVQAIQDNAISVTPVHFDFTHRPLLDTLKSWQLR